jgi:Ca2+-binding EF-hand superfamily protein
MEKEDQLAITFKLMDTDHDGRISNYKNIINDYKL